MLSLNSPSRSHFLLPSHPPGLKILDWSMAQSLECSSSLSILTLFVTSIVRFSNDTLPVYISSSYLPSTPTLNLASIRDSEELRAQLTWLHDLLWLLTSASLSLVHYPVWPSQAILNKTAILITDMWPTFTVSFIFIYSIVITWYIL